MRSPPPEVQGAAEACDELTVTPIHHPPALLEGEKVEKQISEVDPGKKGGVGGRCYKI